MHTCTPALECAGVPECRCEINWITGKLLSNGLLNAKPIGIAFKIIFRDFQTQNGQCNSTKVYHLDHFKCFARAHLRYFITKFQFPIFFVCITFLHCFFFSFSRESCTRFLFSSFAVCLITQQKKKENWITINTIFFIIPSGQIEFDSN